MFEYDHEYVKKGKYFSLMFRTGKDPNGFCVMREWGGKIVSTIFEDVKPCAPGLYCGRSYEGAKMVFNAMESMVNALNISIVDDKERISKTEGWMSNIKKSYEKEYRLDRYENDNRIISWKDQISAFQEDIEKSTFLIDKLNSSGNITIRDLIVTIAELVDDDPTQNEIYILMGKVLFESLDRVITAED